MCVWPKFNSHLHLHIFSKMLIKLAIRLQDKRSGASKNPYCCRQFVDLTEMFRSRDSWSSWIFLMNCCDDFFDKFLWRIFVTNVCYEFLWWIFVTNFLWRIFVTNFLWQIFVTNFCDEFLLRRFFLRRIFCDEFFCDEFFCDKYLWQTFVTIFFNVFIDL